jgi:hypothetical protein
VKPVATSTPTKTSTALPTATTTVTSTLTVTATLTSSEEITSTTPITGAAIGIMPTAGATVVSEETASSGASATPAAMPVTGADNSNRGLAIMLTIAAVLALLIGLSLWEKRGVIN